MEKFEKNWGTKKARQKKRRIHQKRQKFKRKNLKVACNSKIYPL